MREVEPVSRYRHSCSSRAPSARSMVAHSKKLKTSLWASKSDLRGGRGGGCGPGAGPLAPMEWLQLRFIHAFGKLTRIIMSNKTLFVHFI